MLKLDRSAYNLVLDSANVDVDVVHSLQKNYQQTCGTPPPRQRRQQVNYARAGATLGAHGGPSVMGAFKGAFKGGGRRGSATLETADAPAPALRSKPGSPRRYSDPEVRRHD